MSDVALEADIREDDRCGANDPKGTSRLLDHLVGAGEKHQWENKAEHLGGLLVDDQFETRRLLYRQIDGPGRVVSSR